jgi:hypothetical protein
MAAVMVVVAVENGDQKEVGMTRERKKVASY